jgi:hypothetical protein
MRRYMRNRRMYKWPAGQSLERSEWNRFVVSVWKLDCADTLDVRKASTGPTAVNMKLRYRNCNIILQLRLVLQSGLIPLLHTCWFVQTLFKTFQTENTRRLILVVTTVLAVRISSECLESEIDGNTKKNCFGKSEEVQIRTPAYSFESFWTVLHRSSHNKALNRSKLE